MLHHTPDRLHVLKTLRHSWPYAGLRALAIVLPLMLLGAPFAVLFFAPLATIVVGPLAHTNLATRLPCWMHRVFNTPDVHRIHHSIDPLEGNSNFCFVFPVWDVLFGTWMAPEQATVERTGIVDDRVPEGFWRQLALPLTLASSGSPRSRRVGSEIP